MCCGFNLTNTKFTPAKGVLKSEANTYLREVPHEQFLPQLKNILKISFTGALNLMMVGEWVYLLQKS